MTPIAHHAAHGHAPTVPRGLLWAAAGLIAAALLATAAVRLSGVSIHEPDAPALQTRALRFEDLPGGDIAVVDASNGREIERVTGEAGFLRGALRTLARERRARGLGPEAPFALIGRADGRLTLLDPATGTRLDLESFGPTNAAVFGRMLAVNAAAAAPR